jgi:hypothetical protein
MEAESKGGRTQDSEVASERFWKAVMLGRNTIPSMHPPDSLRTKTCTTRRKCYSTNNEICLHVSPSNQCSTFRPWQGWTSLSNTHSNEGTLRVLPFVKLSNAYIILRPFFKPRPGFEHSLDADDWELNLESTEFPGSDMGKAQQLFPETHPHLKLNETVVSIDHVEPGDQVYCTSTVISADLTFLMNF